MKKSVSILLACAMTVCAFTSCGNADESSEVNAVITETLHQKGDSYEEAIKECFNATYTLNGGNVFFTYMYPDAVIDVMKNDNEYEQLVDQFNDNQEANTDMNENKYIFGSVVSSNEITETQENAVKEYFLSFCTFYLPEMTADDLEIKEGYEVTYSYIKNGQEAGQETVIVVSLNDEGWKIITG